MREAWDERGMGMPGHVSGTEGYAQEAAELFERYESIPALEFHRAVLHLIPPAPANVLDIGSGTGRDAAWFAEMGHRVVAVEPTEAMRSGAMRLHPSPHIHWLDDSLPDLAQVRSRGETFDLVMLMAVWMHLDAGQPHQGAQREIRERRQTHSIPLASPLKYRFANPSYSPK